MTVSEYRIQSQEITVEQLTTMFKKQTERVDTIENLEDPQLTVEMGVLNTIRNVLMEQEEILEKMKNGTD